MDRFILSKRVPGRHRIGGRLDSRDGEDSLEQINVLSFSGFEPHFPVCPACDFFILLSCVCFKLDKLDKVCFNALLENFDQENIGTVS